MTFWIDDLDIFFADFGIDAIWSSATFKVLFHNAYEAAALFGHDTESRNPYIEAKDSDVVGLTHASILTINSVAYNPTSIEPDGTGITLIRLAISPTPVEAQKIVTEAGEQIVTEAGEPITTEPG